MTNPPQDPLDIARQKIRVWACALFIEWARAIFILIGIIIALIITFAVLARIGRSTPTATSTASTASTMSTPSTSVITAPEAADRLEAADYSRTQQVSLYGRRIIFYERELQKVKMNATVTTWLGDDKIINVMFDCRHDWPISTKEEAQAACLTVTTDALQLFNMLEPIKTAMANVAIDPEGGVLGESTAPGGWHVELHSAEYSTWLSFTNTALDEAEPTGIAKIQYEQHMEETRELIEAKNNPQSIIDNRQSSIENRPPPPPRPTPDVIPRNWRLLAEYQASSVKPTELFTITRAPWAVDWQCDKKISITVNGAGANADIESTYLGGQPAPEPQVEYLRTTGDFYLNINCRDPYVIRVWEAQ
ncbi:MAG TPA: hypothetical protein VMZ06_17335 [Candidatus Bathyarchaeia archaeon]|nr:hypothetical protein [Candidatus Bathyarchaeia archaeon]